MDVKTTIHGSEILVFVGQRTAWNDFQGYTCIGGRPENQDTLAYDMIQGKYQVFIVCDGMGGHAGGCVASYTAAAALLQSLREQPDDITVEEAITLAVNQANSAVYTKSQDEPSLRGMGTTLTLLVIDSDAAYVTHIGDSRIYQLRNGHKLYRSTDHSMVFEQVAIGNLTEEEARQHPRANILSRAMGVLPDVEFTITKLAYHEDDRFILCSDGVWNSQPEDDIIKMFTAGPDLESMVKMTHETVERIGNETNTSHDNHTMIAIDVLCDSHYQVSLFTKIKNLFNPKKQS